MDYPEYAFDQPFAEGAIVVLAAVPEASDWCGVV